jgi:D-alanyl-D-alanine carboxypeptidase
MTGASPSAGAAERQLQALLGQLASHSDVHSSILAVESGDGAFRWTGAAGAASPDMSPMREDTPYHIASIDKLLTATAILKLHESGVLDIQDSAAAYLPADLVDGLHRWEGIDRTGEITIRHLLGHTSGLADCFEDRPKGGHSLMERLFREGDMAWSVEDLAHRVRTELVPHFAPQPLDAGRQKVRYSDTNYQLLIAILEAVTGQPLHRVYDELLFRPLELRHTWLPGRSAPLEQTSPPAALWLEDRPLDLPQAIRSFPSVYSTASDQMKFLRALVRGEVFADPSTLALMQ